MHAKVLDFLQKEIELQHIPGAVIHVSNKGKVIMQEAVGNRVVYPEKAPMQLDTLFDLASLTKVVATLPVILKLMDDGEIRLDDRVSFFLPDFASEGKEHITLRHLLTHTSGLPAHVEYFKEKLGKEQVIERIYQQPLVYPTGEKVVYSDLGLIMLYQVIEKVTGELFETFVGREIFAPLEMDETGFNPCFSEERYAVTEYNETLKAYKSGIVHDDNTEYMGGISGHAGLFAPVGDLVKFAQMIENNGVFNGKQLLSEAAIQLSRKNYTAFDEEYRGLGWMLKGPTYAPCGDYFSDASFGHTGFTGTSIWFDPAVDLSVILLTNRVHFGRKPAILRLRPRLHNIIRSYFS
ncbi:beta-lactamase family protein [Ornithinibacillus sp. BX22]|uniref:Beta-lactamase family protein n=1 Tax=Ornithinibacillus hominis TaxID=2763055 RepID=A0A923L6W4_9BACI|nr:serine hydrolase domain-containing protein [Ornithinibacillus hominis]MBC5637638.1 beta-lactamase family protein [Ornithinibacillus hominis]